MNKEHRDMLVFGYGLGLISAIFGVGGLIRHGLGTATVILLVCGVTFVSVAALNWQAFRPGYKGWMKVAHLIGTVITTVILAAVYFLVFTPVAFVLKLAGKDHLARRAHRTASSYWRQRPPSETPRERYLQQF